MKYAYCNERWLFIVRKTILDYWCDMLSDRNDSAKQPTQYSDGQPTLWTPNLNEVPAPPKNSAGTYRTGMDTTDLTSATELYFPLNITLLETDSWQNNIGAWASATYLVPPTPTRIHKAQKILIYIYIYIYICARARTHTYIYTHTHTYARIYIS